MAILCSYERNICIILDGLTRCDWAFQLYCPVASKAFHQRLGRMGSGLKRTPAKITSMYCDRSTCGFQVD